MSRPAARISHDEVTRMVKAVKRLGLPIARVSYDGNRLDVIIGEIGETGEDDVDGHKQEGRPAEVETL